MKRKHTFGLTAPEASSVLLVGDFTNWQTAPIPMKRKRNGNWETAVTLNAGTYGYRFIVDDQWRDDPNSTLQVPNPYGSQNAVVEVS